MRKLHERPAVDRRPLELWWTCHDELALFGRLAVALSACAIGFAIVGLPHVPLMWPIHHLGLVDPTCGLTCGVVAIDRGDTARAWAFNPASFLVVAATAALLVRLTFGHLTGRCSAFGFGPVGVSGVSVALAFVVLCVNQQRHAGLTIHQLR